MSIVNTSIHLYRRLLRVLNFLQCPFLLFVRVYWGWQFWQTGWGKLQDISKPIGFFTELGIPFPVFNACFFLFWDGFGEILPILDFPCHLSRFRLFFTWPFPSTPPTRGPSNPT